MSALRRAEAAQHHADASAEELPSASASLDVWSEIADNYVVAADAWLEANEPKEAAYALLQAGWYKRRGFFARPIHHSGGYPPSFAFAEAAQLASLAGWIDTDQKGRLKLQLPATDSHGRRTSYQLDELMRMTALPLGSLWSQQWVERRMPNEIDRMQLRTMLLTELRRLGAR